MKSPPRIIHCPCRFRLGFFVISLVDTKLCLTLDPSEGCVSGHFCSRTGYILLEMRYEQAMMF